MKNIMTEKQFHKSKWKPFEIMTVFIKRLNKKWGDWENEEKVLIFGERVIHTNNYTIQLFVIFFLLLWSIIFY